MTKHVAVLMGGWSAERQVSLRSGKACADALDRLGYRVTAIDAGRDVAIATREAVTGDDLATLDQTVLGRFRADIEAERTERVESTRLQLNAIRQIVSHLGSRARVGGGSFA